MKPHFIFLIFQLYFAKFSKTEIQLKYIILLHFITHNVILIRYHGKMKLVIKTNEIRLTFNAKHKMQFSYLVLKCYEKCIKS